MLDAGNSGSTIRMLSGILAAQPFATRIGGDESLSRRPMQRIMQAAWRKWAPDRGPRERYPATDDSRNASCTPIDYTLPVASAQVKSCVLLAGPVRRRQHHGARAGAHARSHRARAAGIRRGGGGRRSRSITVAGRPATCRAAICTFPATCRRRRSFWWRRCWCRSPS